MITTAPVSLRRTPAWARYHGGTYLPGEDPTRRDEARREMARWPRVCQPVPPAPDLEIRPAGMPIAHETRLTAGERTRYRIRAARWLPDADTEGYETVSYVPRASESPLGGMEAALVELLIVAPGDWEAASAAMSRAVRILNHIAQDELAPRDLREACEGWATMLAHSRDSYAAAWWRHQLRSADAFRGALAELVRELASVTFELAYDAQFEYARRGLN